MQSKQLLLVTTPNWEAVNGQLLLYQRVKPHAKWKKTGDALAVVVGQAGMGWGVELAKNQWPGPIKQEGDRRSPVGAFQLGPLFGFEPNFTAPQKLAYFPLTETSVCVDDVNSQYYNQLLDSSTVAKPDWISFEQMRQTPLYYWGSVIQYNMPQPVQAGGSCIFMHIWRGPDRGTAGCVAMDEAKLVALLSQLDPAKKPVLVMLTEPAYRYLKTKWNLPDILYP